MVELKEIICSGCSSRFKVESWRSQKYCNRECYKTHEKPWNKGKSLSLESRKKMSLAKKGKRLGKNNILFGKYAKGKRTQALIKEARINACEKYGWYHIPRGFVVHHINGDVRNNSQKNLVIVSRGDHNRIHHKLRSYLKGGD